MEDDATVLEGFLCPMCKRNLNSVYQLQAHFEEAHGAEEKLGGQLRGFLGKAKRKILGKKEDFDYDDGYSSPFPASHSSASGSLDKTGEEGTDPFTWAAEFGATRSHIQLFKSIRGSRINHIVVETNKLLFRLEKLVQFYDTEPEKSKRKAYEKSVVPWAPDSDVKFCPSCGIRFNLANRRHHCRLCGSIICKDCSGFLEDDLCAKVVKFKRSPSRRLPGSKKDEEESGLRVCQNCEKMILRTHQQNQQDVSRTDIVQLYEKLSNVKQKILAETPRYNAIAESLNSGEMDHDLNYANEVRGQVLKLFDVMDLISCAWTKGTEVTKMKAQESEHSGSGTGGSGEAKGWKPQVVNQAKLDAQDDPLEQQITIIKNFLEQARRAGKMDEVKMLEDNLRDLQKEKYFQKLK
ncbi:rabenosyn-5-like [Anneissia japonica]|uniref:rabenosyn-5-like n=1 Tax=Anneissia japonica TaxID=1529436 RepID=UPI00142573E7|nr:rabenosyn-5-like [Anneissia japonica]